MSALNKYDFAYGSILTIFAAPRRRPEPYEGREWVRPRLSLWSYMMSATGSVPCITAKMRGAQGRLPR